MNFIGKHLALIGILLLTVFVGAAVGLYFDLPACLQRSRPVTAAQPTYPCPMHAEVVQDRPGDCPNRGMALVAAGQTETGHEPCGSSGENHPGCCADKGAMRATTEMKLPPGHPPIPGWTAETNATSEPKPSSPEGVAPSAR